MPYISRGGVSFVEAFFEPSRRYWIWGKYFSQSTVGSVCVRWRIVISTIWFVRSDWSSSQLLSWYRGLFARIVHWTSLHYISDSLYPMHLNVEGCTSGILELSDAHPRKLNCRKFQPLLRKFPNPFKPNTRFCRQIWLNTFNEMSVSVNFGATDTSPGSSFSSAETPGWWLLSWFRTAAISRLTPIVVKQLL